MTVCRWCAAELEPMHVESCTCDPCWYGMRLSPDSWSEYLESIGRPVRVVNGFYEPTQPAQSS